MSEGTHCQGRFFDGRTARAQAVEVKLVTSGIEILLLDQDPPEWVAWSFADLHAAGEQRQRDRLRLGSRYHPSARLEIEDKAFIVRLTAQNSKLNPDRQATVALKPLALSLGLAAVLGGLILGLPRIAAHYAPYLPQAWLEGLASGTIAMVDRFSNRCENKRGQAALDQMVARLGGAEAIDRPLNVWVSDIAVTNAFALPGGTVVILKGLIDKASGPDEVAGVLAHEMGHVQHYHPAKGLIQQVGLQLIIASLTGADIGGILVDVAGSGYTRGDEAEADRAGLALLQAANISPAGFAAFFERIGEDEGVFAPLGQLTATHPAPKDRAERAWAAAEAFTERAQPALSEADWKALQSICDQPGRDSLPL